MSHYYAATPLYAAIMSPLLHGIDDVLQLLSALLPGITREILRRQTLPLRRRIAATLLAYDGAVAGIGYEMATVTSATVSAKARQARLRSRLPLLRHAIRPATLLRYRPRTERPDTVYATRSHGH